MLHMNKANSKYANLYRLVNNVYCASSLRTLDFSSGVIVGWTCALFPSEWSAEELGRFDMLVKMIEIEKRKQFEGEFK